MATRGRKPTPTAIKELEGNPGKRKLNENEPKPERKAPACPKWLDKDAKKGMAPAGEEDGSSRNPYRSRYGSLRCLLPVLCEMEGSRGVHQEHGSLVRTPSGYWQQVPQVSIAQTYMKQMGKFATEFGLTPASRSRLIADAGENKPGDEMEELLGGDP
jgi:phage terminase small subunit